MLLTLSVHVDNAADETQLQSVAMCCSVLQCVVACCSAWQCGTMCCSVLQSVVGAQRTP